MAEILDILNLGTQTVSASSTPNIGLKRFYATVYIQCTEATASPVVTVAVSYDGGTTWSDVAVGTPGSTSYAAGATIALAAGTLLEVPTAGATNIKVTRSSGTSAVFTVTGVQFPAANRGVLANLNAAVQSEDAAHASGDKGLLALAVRNNTASALATTNGDYIPLTTDTNGGLWVSLATLIAGEDQTNGLLAVLEKPLVGSTYAHSFFNTVENDVDLLVKGSAGNLKALTVWNYNAAKRYVMLFNKATAPANGDTPTDTFVIPAGSANNPGVLSLTDADLGHGGKYFATGIGVGISTTTGTLTGATTTDHVIWGRYI